MALPLPFFSGEVAEAMTEMVKAGWSATQILDGMAGVLDATAASREGLGTVSMIVAEVDGKGADKWGKLKSNAGWISLDYAKRI